MASPLRFSQIFFELIECAFESTLHRLEATFECFAFGFACVDGNRFNGQLGLVALLFQCESRQRFQRPLWSHRVPGDTTIRIGESTDKDKPLRRNYFSKNPFAPHFKTTWNGHFIVKNAARARLEFLDTELHSLRPPPVSQMLALSACFENQFSWGIDYA